jgi:diaphanous 1
MRNRIGILTLAASLVIANCAWAQTPGTPVQPQPGNPGTQVPPNTPTPPMTPQPGSPGTQVPPNTPTPPVTPQPGNTPPPHSGG